MRILHALLASVFWVAGMLYLEQLIGVAGLILAGTSLLLAAIMETPIIQIFQDSYETIMEEVEEYFDDDEKD